MSGVLVLDAEALSALTERRGRRYREVQAALDGASRLGTPVATPAVVLAELYRGRGRNELLDAWLRRETGVAIEPTDRYLARMAGGVLAAARAGSEDMVDAHCVAVAVHVGRGVVLTGDPDDLRRLAAPYPNVTIVSI